MSHSLDQKSAGYETRGRTPLRPAVLERYTSSASTAGHGHKSISTETRRRLAGEQVAGYARVGLAGRIKACGQIPIVREGLVGLSVDGGALGVHGMARCGSRWCPECWGRVAAHRAGELAQVARWAHGQGHVLVMATLTASHVTTEAVAATAGDYMAALVEQDVKELFDRLAAAWRFAHAGRGGVELKRGRVGYARAFELTTDALDTSLISGAHGHFHVLLVLEAGVDIEAYGGLLWERWRRGCERHGLWVGEMDAAAFKEVEIDADNPVEKITSYLVKGESLTAEKIGLELTRSDVKRGGRSRISPEGLLREIGRMSEEEYMGMRGRRAYARWLGVERACKARRWLTWSRDLRSLAGLGADMSDEDIANAVEVAATEGEGGHICVVSWDDIKAHVEELEQAIQAVSEARRMEVLVMCLAGLGVGHRLVSREVWGEMVCESLRRRRRGRG